jgi:hypothetical protein
VTTKFGWCLDGFHVPPDDDPGVYQCPGQIGGPDGLRCTCDCHDEEREG